MTSIQCVFITPEHYDAVVRFARENYLKVNISVLLSTVKLFPSNPFQDEPLCQFLQLQGTTVMDPFFQSVIEQGTSVMAIDTANGNEIVGVRAHLVKQRGEVECIPPGLTDERAIAMESLVSFAFDRYNPWTHLLVDKFLHFKFLVVQENYRGQNIGVQMTKFTLDWMRQQGIPVAYVWATNIYSKRSLEKAGFITVDEMKYEDYEVNGKVVFRPPSIHTGFATLIKWAE